MEPDPERHERYLGEYQLFFEAYRRLESWFDKSKSAGRDV